jgi:hypothetical protein
MVSSLGPRIENMTFIGEPLLRMFHLSLLMSSMTFWIMLRLTNPWVMNLTFLIVFAHNLLIKCVPTLKCTHDSEVLGMHAMYKTFAFITLEVNFYMMFNKLHAFSSSTYLIFDRFLCRDSSQGLGWCISFKQTLGQNYCGELFHN